jgi:hypothetical protein
MPAMNGLAFRHFVSRPLAACIKVSSLMRWQRLGNSLVFRFCLFLCHVQTARTAHGFVWVLPRPISCNLSSLLCAYSSYCTCLRSNLSNSGRSSGSGGLQNVKCTIEDLPLAFEPTSQRCTPDAPSASRLSLFHCDSLPKGVRRWQSPDTRATAAQ